MALSAVTSAQATVGFTYNVVGPVMGPDYVGNIARGTPQLGVAYTLGADLTKKINLIYSKITTLAASANTTLNLTSLQGVDGSTINFARVLGWCFRLLSVTDDPINGTACSGITIGNAASNAFLFNAWTATKTENLGNGEGMAFATPLAAGYTVGGSNENVKLVNNDGGVGAAIEVSFWGADA